MTTKTELESKHLAELHELAADGGVERYRMLSRAELIEKLAGGESKAAPKPRGERGGGGSGRGRQRDRDRKPRDGRGEREPRGERQERRPRQGEQKSESQRQSAPAHRPVAAEPVSAAAPAERPKRKRRRRWGRRPKGVRIHDLLLPAVSGRQTIVYAESRAGCTALLREVAAELSAASQGPDPIALLIDPTPEELADWKREAPKAEIVSAGKANHAGDALAQARARADGGEAAIVLIDSLSRFAEAFGTGADEARELFDAGLGMTGGSLTVVAAVERSV
jgi:Rho termination factor, N-terminal domain